MSLSSLTAIWSSRSFILSSVRREFQLKYRNSVLGAAWTVINPLAMIFVYTVIFSHMMRTKMPGNTGAFSYSIYLCAGSLTWGLFSEVVSRAQNVFIDNANLIKKINFPRLCLPVIVIVNALLNFGIIFGLFVVFLMFSGNFPGHAFIALVPLLAVLIVFAIGLGITLGVANVFFRDVGHFFGIFMQFWFWFTPIVYPVTALPARINELLVLNPMAGVIEGFHSVLVRDQFPSWGTMAYPLVAGVLLCLIGLSLYRKNVGEMVDEL